MAKLVLTIDTAGIKSAGKEVVAEVDRMSKSFKGLFEAINTMQRALDRVSAATVIVELNRMKDVAQKNFKIVKTSAEDLRGVINSIDSSNIRAIRAPRDSGGGGGGGAGVSTTAVGPSAASTAALASLGGASHLAAVELDNANRAAAAFSATMSAVVPALNEVQLAQARAAQESIRFVEAINRIKTMVPVFSETTASVQSLSNAMTSLGPGAQRIAEASTRAASSMREVGVAASLASKEANQLRERFGLLPAGAARFQQAMEAINRAFKIGTISSKEFIQLQVLARSELDATAAKMRGIGAAGAQAAAGTTAFAGAFRAINASATLLFGPLSRMGSTIIGLNLILGAFDSKLQALGLVGFLGFVTGAVKAVQAATAFEQATANLGVVTDKTGAELEQLSSGLLDLSTKLGVPNAEILKIANTVAELGVRATKDIIAFTQAMAQFSRIGEQVDVTDITQQFGVLLAVTKTAPENINNVASAVLRLAQDFNATKVQVLENGNAIGRAVASFGVGAVEAVALGAALRSVGVQAEVGATAVQRVMGKMREAVQTNGVAFEELVETVGGSSESVRNLVQTNIVGAFKLFIEGVANVKAAGGNFTKILDDFGISGARGSKAIRPLVNDVDLFAKALGKAGISSQEATLLMEQFEKASNTLSRRFETLGVAIENFFVKAGSNAIPIISKLLDGMIKLARNTELLAAAADSVAIFVGAFLLMKGIVPLILGTLNALVGLIAVIASGGGLFTAFGVLVGGSSLAVAGLTAAILIGIPALANYVFGLDEAKKAAADQSSALEETITQFDKFILASDRLAQAGRLDETQFASLRLEIKALAGDVANGTLSIAERTEKQAELSSKIQEFLNLAGISGNVIVQESEAYKKAAQEIGKMGDALATAKSTIAEVAAGGGIGDIADIDALQRARAAIVQLTKGKDQLSKTEILALENTLKYSESLKTRLTPDLERLAQVYAHTIERTQALTAVSSAMSEVATQTGESFIRLSLANDNLHPTVEKLAIALIKAANAGHVSAGEFKQLRKFIADADATFKQNTIVEELFKLIEGLRLTVITVDALNPSLTRAEQTAAEAQATISQLESAIRVLADAGKQVDPVFQALVASLTKLKFLQEIASIFGKLEDQVDALAHSSENLDPAVESMVIALERARDNGRVTTEEFLRLRESLDKLQDGFREAAVGEGLQAALDGIRERSINTQSSVLNLDSSLQEMFTNLVVGAQQGKVSQEALVRISEAIFAADEAFKRNTIAEESAAIAKAIRDVRSSVDALNPTLSETSRVVIQGRTSLSALETALGTLAEQGLQATPIFEELSSAFARLQISTDIVDAFSKVEQKFAEIALSSQHLAPEVVALTIALDNARASGAVTAQDYARLSAQVTNLGEAFKSAEIAETIAGVNEQIRISATTIPLLSPALSSLEVGFKFAQENVSTLETAVKNLISKGFTPASPALSKLIGELVKYRSQAEVARIATEGLAKAQADMVARGLVTSPDEGGGQQGRAEQERATNESIIRSLGAAQEFSNLSTSALEKLAKGQLVISQAARDANGAIKLISPEAAAAEASLRAGAEAAKAAKNAIPKEISQIISPQTDEKAIADLKAEIAELTKTATKNIFLDVDKDSIAKVQAAIDEIVNRTVKITIDQESVAAEIAKLKESLSAITSESLKLGINANAIAGEIEAIEIPDKKITFHADLTAAAAEVAAFVVPDKTMVVHAVMDGSPALPATEYLAYLKDHIVETVSNLNPTVQISANIDEYKAAIDSLPEPAAARTIRVAASNGGGGGGGGGGGSGGGGGNVARGFSPGFGAQVAADVRNNPDIFGGERFDFAMAAATEADAAFARLDQSIAASHEAAMQNVGQSFESMQNSFYSFGQNVDLANTLMQAGIQGAFSDLTFDAMNIPVNLQGSPSLPASEYLDSYLPGKLNKLASYRPRGITVPFHTDYSESLGKSGYGGVRGSALSAPSREKQLDDVVESNRGVERRLARAEVLNKSTLAASMETADATRRTAAVLGGGLGSTTIKAQERTLRFTSGKRGALVGRG